MILTLLLANWDRLGSCLGAHSWRNTFDSGVEIAVERIDETISNTSDASVSAPTVTVRICGVSDCHVLGEPAHAVPRADFHVCSASLCAFNHRDCRETQESDGRGNYEELGAAERSHDDDDQLMKLNYEFQFVCELSAE